MAKQTLQGIFVSDDPELDGIPVCISCNKRPISIYRSWYRCDVCLDKDVIARRKRREDRWKKGLCVDCGKNPIEWFRSSRLCNRCLDRNIINRKIRNGTAAWEREKRIAEIFDGNPWKMLDFEKKHPEEWGRMNSPMKMIFRSR